MTFDYAYLVLLLLLLAFAVYEWIHPSLSDRMFRYATVVMGFFTLFRAPVICLDMWDYTKDAIGVGSTYTDAEDTIEPLYVVYKSIFENFCPYIFPFMVITSLIIFIPIWLLIKRYSPYKALSVLTFILLLRFDIFWGILRQCVALSFMLWGVMSVMENRRRKWLIYALLSVAAYFFHHSSALVTVIFVGCYFMPLKNRLIPIATIFVTFVIGMVLQAFDFFAFLRIVDTWGIVEEKYSNTYIDEFSKMNSESEGGIGLTTMARPILAMLIFLFIDKERINHWFSKIFFVGIVLLNLFTTLALLNRMLIANMLFGTLLVSWVLDSKAYLAAQSRSIVRWAMIVVVFLYSIAYCRYYVWGWDIYAAARTHPFYFIWEDYSQHPAIMKW